MIHNLTGCTVDSDRNFSGILGELSVPVWEAFFTIISLTLIILLTIVGNVLVILSVFTYKPLRIVQNFFIVSLAVADLTVAILVLPLNVAYSVLGRWVFGIHVCKMWLTSDILCCTASILNLCAIALDRFWAITDPINYAQKRTVKRVLIQIAGVWVLSLLISSPPLVGWNDWPEPEVFLKQEICKLTERQGYVIYSSSGSFYIPLFIMTIVYIEIFIATKRRLRERAKASKINAISKNQTTCIDSNKGHNEDRESVSSETNHNEHDFDNKSKTKKAKKARKKRKCEHESEGNNAYLKPVLVYEDSVTDYPETSSNSQRRPSNPSLYENKNLQCSTTTTVTFNSTNSPQSTVNPQNVHTGVTSITKKPVVVSQFIEEKQRISLSKERRAARTLGIIMGVFVICWLPFFLMYVILPFCPSCCPPTKRFVSFITWLGYINSVLNPIIYTIFNLDFRRAFRRLLGLRI